VWFRFCIRVWVSYLFTIFVECFRLHHFCHLIFSVLGFLAFELLPIFYIMVSFTLYCITLIADKLYQFCTYLSQLVFAVRHRTRIGVSSLTSQVVPQLNPSQDAWVPFIVCCRWVGGVAVCSVPDAHPVHLLCSLEVLTHPLTKVAQVYNVLITHWILLNLHCSFL